MERCFIKASEPSIYIRRASYDVLEYENEREGRVKGMPGIKRSRKTELRGESYIMMKGIKPGDYQWHISSQQL